MKKGETGRSRLDDQKRAALAYFGLIEFFHQARFATRGVVLFDDAFLRGAVERADCLPYGFFAFFHFARREQRARLFHFRPGGHSHDAVMCAVANTLAPCFESRVFFCFLYLCSQFQNPPELFRAHYTTSWRF